MADLDDFFAKKDKKKKTKKFPKANTEVLASKLEESARREQQADMKAAMGSGESTYNKENHAEGVSRVWSLCHHIFLITLTDFVIYKCSVKVTTDLMTINGCKY